MSSKNYRGYRPTYVNPHVFIARDDRDYDDPWTSDVSAEHGAHAEHGWPDYSGSGRASGTGRDGGHAKPAFPASSTGHQRLCFESDPDQPHLFSVVGIRVHPDEHVEQVDIPQLDAHTGRDFVMKANGGNGGDGGRGGQGQDGGRGRSTSMTGANGGDGYDGGDGGLGSDGAAASDGGKNVAEYRFNDTYLAGLVIDEVAGGVGGEAGRHGRGGDGGPGGSGGPGRSAQYRTRTKSDGSTERILVRHAIAPGRNGWSGSDGRTPNRPLYHGRNGQDGVTCHIVYDEQGVVGEYRSAWRLVCDGFEIREGSAFGRSIAVKESNAIYEPNEILETDHFAMHNTGEMPMSHNFETRVYLEKNEHVIPLRVTNDNELVEPTHADETQIAVLRDPLNQDVPHTLSGQVLSFRLADIDYIPEDAPLDVPFIVRPLAVQTGIDRFHDDFDAPRHERMRFPSDTDKPSSMEAMEPGQLALFELKVNNRGQLGLGRESETQRDLAAFVRLVTHDMLDFVMLLDIHGHELSERGLRERIESLPSGENTTLSIYVGVLPSAVPYSGFNIQSDLELGRLYDPNNPRTILRRNYRARVAQKYRFDPDADILLITNRDTDAAGKNAIEATAKAMGRKVNIWDISLNNELSLSRELDHGFNLLRDFHGHTIVITNNAFETINGTRFGDQFLSQMDLIRAGESHNIGIVLLNPKGHNVDSLFTLRLYPTEEQEVEYEFDSVKEFSAGTNSEWVDAELTHDVDEMMLYHGKDASKLDPTRMTSRIKIFGRYKPDAKKLRKIARQVQLSVERANPGRRVMAMVKVNPYTGTTWKEWWAKKELGTITIMPTVGDAKPNTIVLDVDEEDIHDPEFLKSKTLRTALAQGMSFDKLTEKLLTRIKRHMSDPDFLPDSEHDKEGELLIDSLLGKIAIRQASLQKAMLRGKLTPQQLRKGMVNLQSLRDEFADLIPTFFAHDQPAVTHLLARLIAGLRSLGKSQGRWSWFLPGFRGWSRSWQVRDETLRVAKYLEQKWFTGGSERDLEAAKQALKQHRDHFRVLQRDIAKRKDLSVPQAARQAVLHSILTEGIRMDALTQVDRVIMQDEWREICARENEHIKDRLELAEAKRENQAKYLVVDEGTVLPGQESHPTDKFVATCAEHAASTKKREDQPDDAEAKPHVLEYDQGIAAAKKIGETDEDDSGWDRKQIRD